MIGDARPVAASRHVDGLPAAAAHLVTLPMNLGQREEAAGKRSVMRTILGTEMLRAVDFK